MRHYVSGSSYLFFQKRLVVCICASLVLHATGLFFVPFQKSNPSSPCISIAKKPSPDEILKEAFSLGSAQILNKNEPVSISLSPPNLLPTSFKTMEELHFFSSKECFELPVPSLQPPLCASNLSFPSPFDAIPKPLIEPEASSPIQLALTAQKEPLSTSFKASFFASSSQTPTPSCESLFPRSNEPLTSLEVDHKILQLPSLITPDLPRPLLPILSDLETISYSDAFDVELICSPKKDGSGYLFAITLVPIPDLYIPKTRQHYTFLIDRSNSIQKDRLSATKKAVFAALEQLYPDDTFNLIAFDNKVHKLFPAPVDVNPNTLAQAKSFLEQLNLGSFFSPADLYKPLLLTLPSSVDEEEVHTAILLTNGETLSKASGIRSVLQTWTWQNNGKVSLYCFSMQGDYQMPTLELASAMNRGKSFFSSTKRGMKRRLSKLMKMINLPIANSLCFHLCPTSETVSNSSFQLYPKPDQAPPLSLSEPYVFIGSCKTLEDFVLFIQGKRKDRWFNIKKEISFSLAKKGGETLQKQWALQKAYECYERYVFDNNPTHLSQAKGYLEPFNLPCVFQ